LTDWFSNLKNIVNRHEPKSDPHALPRAAAALMLEMALTDSAADQAELATVHRAMQQAFGLEPSELDELMDQAHQAKQQSVSLYEFTRDLRTGLQPEQRVELIEWMWRVAYADTRLDADEELLVRRLADLLGVSHQDFIRAKLAAKA